MLMHGDAFDKTMRMNSGHRKRSLHKYLYKRQLFLCLYSVPEGGQFTSNFHVKEKR